MFLKLSWTVPVFCINFSLGGPCRNSTSNYRILLQQGASVFLFSYSLLFDDSCSRVSTYWKGTDLGARRIYCLMQRTGCMDLLHELLVHHSYIFKSGLPHQQPSLEVERVPEYLQILLLILHFTFLFAHG